MHETCPEMLRPGKPYILTTATGQKIDGGPRSVGYDTAIARSKPKRHLEVDTLRLMIAVVITAAPIPKRASS